ncbi:MAG: rod shape-determining protein MreD [Fibromonadaceae bacterium]|jgi:rod shape-determining protein MreD|nr:rod shape-determining protein MreD [Fibromonadaceae bacterium]
MIRFFVYAFLFFVAAILQTVVVPQIGVLGAQPSLLLILVVMAALRHGALAGCFLGFLSGLLCDVYAPIEWLGAYSFSYCLIGFAVGQIEESFINLNFGLKITVLAAAGLLKDILYFFCIGKRGDEIWQSFVSLTIPNCIYTVVLGVVFFYLLTPRVEAKIEIHK